MFDKTIRLSYPLIKRSATRELRKVIKSGYLTQGPKAEAFEKLVAKFIGSENAIATSSCTTALHLSLHSLGIGPGDEVIIPDYTFPATANAAIQTQATPKIIDVSPKDFNIDVSKIEEAICAKTKAIIVVHAFGMCADMNEINNIAKKFNLVVIEDSACALGSEYLGRMAGNLSDIACFSFHPRKIITTGEGGMITTNDNDLAEKIAILASHGGHKNSEEPFKNTYTEYGFNYRMSDINAALGIVEMQRINNIVQNRRKMASQYKENLKNSEFIEFQQETHEKKSNYQSFVIKLNEKVIRNSVIQILSNENIQSNIGTYSLVSEPVFTKFNNGNLQNSIKLAKSTLAIPLHEHMTRKQIDKVSEKLLIAIDRSVKTDVH